MKGALECQDKDIWDQVCSANLQTRAVEAGQNTGARYEWKGASIPLHMTVDILLQLLNDTVQTLAKNREEKTPLFTPLESIVFSETTKFASTLRYE